MATAREILEGASANLDESMGMRSDPRPSDQARVTLAPVPLSKDIGRSPRRKFGAIRIEQVIADPEQPRHEFADEELTRLADSIRTKGQLMPVGVRWSSEHNKWVIIFGERRWRAALLAGLSEIDCHFHEAPLSRSEILERQVIENCLREDLQPVEEAQAFAKLIEMNAWTAKQLSEALNVTQSRVSRALALLRLPEDVQKQVDVGTIPARSAYELSRLNNPEMQKEMAEKLATGTMNGGQVQRAVRQRKGKASQETRRTRQTFIGEEGWKVEVTGPAKGTYHHIERALVGALEDVRHRIQHGRDLY